MSKADRKKRQAVVVVHGIGEQRPGETLDNILKGLGKSPALKGTKLTYVPDRRTGSRELYRVTTVPPEGDDGRRTDFYEFYWADIMAGNTLDDVKAWVFGLLMKRFKDVPAHVRLAWAGLWGVTLAIVLLAVLTVLTLINNQTYGSAMVVGLCLTVSLLALVVVRTMARRDRDWLEKIVAVALKLGFAAIVLVPLYMLGLLETLFGHPGLYTGAILALVIYGVGRFVVPYVGDVARYTRVTPETIAKRAEVINRGLVLLRALHGMAPTGAQESAAADADAVPDYDRVIVVAHSLGTVIAYDLLRHLWMECGPVRGGIASPQGVRSLKQLGEKMVRWDNADPLFDLTSFRAAQRSVSADLAQTPYAWRVSDFVTIGSPLTHAEFLLSDDQQKLQERFALGFLATVPPRHYDAQGNMLDMAAQGKNPLVYESDGKLVAHHTAAFAATRWTNIYDDPQGGIFSGDVVSGPLRSLFGIGISDVNVTLKKGGMLNRVFTHTSYWLAGVSADIVAPPNWIETALGADASAYHLDVLAAAMELDEAPRPHTQEA